MSGPSKLRRSARSRLKVDYTKGLGDGDDDDYADSSQVGDSVALAAKTGSATRRTIAASAKMQNQDVKVEGDGDEDSDYARRPKKKPKLAVVKRQRVILSYAERVELRMKTTCFIFNIPYSTFDKWPFSLNPEQDGGPSLSTMPNEVLLLIFSFSRSDDLLSLRKTCKHFRALLRHESIWRESRLNYLPPLPSELPTPLPFGLTEIKLYLLSFSKSCSHCGQVAKPQARPRVFYNWGMRGCKDCVKQYTILHKDLMALLSKKCGFDFHEREALVSTLESHDHSMWRYRGIFWKAQVYERLEDAEIELVSDNFTKWAKDNKVPHSVEQYHGMLDKWRWRAADAIMRNEIDFHCHKRRQRRFLLIELCKRLPEPIPEQALPFLNRFMILLYRNTELQKSEFIEALPFLLKEWASYREEQTQVARLERIWRIQLQYFIEETAGKILADLHIKGDIDPITWRQILIRTITKAANVKPRYRMPKDASDKYTKIFKDWKLKNKLGGRELGKLDKALTQPIYSGIEFFKQVPESADDRASENREIVLPRTIYEFFERGNDRVFACPYRWGHRKTDHICNHATPMTLLELVEHCAAKHSANWNDKKETTWERIMDHLVLHPNFGGEIYCFLGPVGSVFPTGSHDGFRCYPSSLRSTDPQGPISVMVVAKKSGIVGYLINASSERVTSGPCCCKPPRYPAINLDTTGKDISGMDFQVAVASNAESNQKHRKASIETFGRRSEVFSRHPSACISFNAQHMTLKGTYVRLKITFGDKSKKLDAWLKSVPTQPATLTD